MQNLPDLSDLDITQLTMRERRNLLALLEEQELRRSRNKIQSFYPDEGPLRRELYPRHMEFFRAGAQYRERCFLAANRIGKSEGAGGYETTLHLTGKYPYWWEGRRFSKPVRAVAAGKSNETTRDIIQAKLFGGIQRAGGREFDGTGLVPHAAIGPCTWKQGVSDLADTVRVKHASGGWSTLALKSYQQGRGSFEGTEREVIWLDEEPPMDIYGECLIRTATTGGIVYTTFTPLDGMTQMALSFLPGGRIPNAQS